MSAGRRSDLSTAGASGEAETAGLVMNLVPKTGGNTTRARSSPAARRETQSDNLTRTLMDQGVAAATPLSRVYDFPPRRVVRS